MTQATMPMVVVRVLMQKHNLPELQPTEQWRQILVPGEDHITWELARRSYLSALMMNLGIEWPSEYGRTVEYGVRWGLGMRLVDFTQPDLRRATLYPKVPVDGIYEKFTVIRNDGQSEPGGIHHGCEYFVLDVTHDPYALPALEAYAKACADTHPVLARDVLTRVERGQG